MSQQGHEGGGSGQFVGSAVRVLGGDAPVAGVAKYTRDFQFPG